MWHMQMVTETATGPEKKGMEGFGAEGQEMKNYTLRIKYVITVPRLKHVGASTSLVEEFKFEKKD